MMLNKNSDHKDKKHLKYWTDNICVVNLNFFYSYSFQFFLVKIEPSLLYQYIILLILNTQISSFPKMLEVENQGVKKKG